MVLSSRRTDLTVFGEAVSGDLERGFLGRPLNFADRLSRQVEERRSQLVLGLDPDPTALLASGQSVVEEGMDASEAAATAVFEHCRSLIESVGDLCVGVKPQLACFERLGHDGLRALDRVIGLAHENDLLVITDGKRADVPHTSVAYAEGLFAGTETPWGPVAGMGSDAVTVNPYLGSDSLEPFVKAAVDCGAGVFVLVRTSNPSAGEFQDLICDGRPVHEHVASMVAAIGSEHVGDCGLSSVGAVVGATAPDQVGSLRKIMPDTPFLLPGIGAQGGELEDIADIFKSRPAAALATVARSIVFAHLKHGGDPISAARKEAERVRDTCWAASK